MPVADDEEVEVEVEVEVEIPVEPEPELGVEIEIPVEPEVIKVEAKVPSPVQSSGQVDFCPLRSAIFT